MRQILASICVIVLLSSFTEGYYKFRKIDMSSGLSFNSVLCLLQDQKGYLWIGTRDGLNKYNSLDNVIYKHQTEDSTSLSNSDITTLFETREGELWAGTVKGLNRFNREENIFFQYHVSDDSTGLSNGYIRCFLEDDNGDFWIGTSFGLNKFVNESFQHLFIEEPPTYANNIISLFQDNEKRLWIGTKAGLYLYFNGQFSPIKLIEDFLGDGLFEIRDIKQAHDGKFLIATEKHGLFTFYFDSDNGVQELNVINETNSKLISNTIRKILTDGDTVWLATLQGVVIVHGNNQLHNITYDAEKKDGISKSSVHDIIKDQLGGYWFATYTGGLNYYHPQNNLFQYISSFADNSINLESNSVTDFLEDRKGNLWISTGAEGLIYWNRKLNKYKNFKVSERNSISSNNIKSISEDDNGNLWIGTFNGLNYFDNRTGNFTNYFHLPNNSNSLNNNQVHAVHVDKNGMVWIGMNGGEIQMYNPEFNMFNAVSGVGSIVDVLFEDSKGRLWIGERSGLKCLDISTALLLDISSMLKPVQGKLNYINCISEDSKGRILIGTQDVGLVIIDEKHTMWLNSEKEFIGNTINAVLEDNDKNLWISTNKGVSKLVFSKNETYINRTVNYTESQGLKGFPFEKGSALKTRDGLLFYGGLNGINFVDPTHANQLRFFPDIVLSDFEVHMEMGVEKGGNIPEGKTIDDYNYIELNYNERNITLSFAGLNFIDPESTFYRYSIGTLKSNWIELNHQRQLNFTYLPVGKHEIRIQATTDSSNWGKKYKSFTINILPPWWKKWWAYTLYLLLIFGLLYLLFNYYQRWISLKNSLKMEHYKREQELTLHESKLRFFTDISHELRTPLTLILSPLENILSKKRLDHDLNRRLLLISKNGNRMMRLINQVLDLRRLETGNEKLVATKNDIVSFLKEISLLFNEIAHSKGIRFEFATQVEALVVWFDKDKMESVIYNLLSNALKHTPKYGHVKLHLAVPKSNEEDKGNMLLGMVHIEITNEGKGIEKGELDHIFDRFYSGKSTINNKFGIGVGLELCKRMVELHRGKIMVESITATDQKTGLTSFLVDLPLGKSHVSESETGDTLQESETVALYTEKMPDIERKVLFTDQQREVEDANDSNEAKSSLLIVEDNNEVRKLVCDLLRNNYQIEEAANGKEGWKMAIKTIPDLVISDVMMPEMDGLELCKRLKSDIRTSHIPVILLTARATFAHKYEGFEVGADDYVNKPFSVEFLQLRIKNLIQQRHSLRKFYRQNAFIETQDKEIKSVDERLLKKAVDFILTNIEDSNISVEKLSREVGLSRVHFYRKIKALTNQTAVDFIRSIRLKRAASLLQQNKLSIKEIQHMVGFDDSAYFRKCFKEYFEMTPSDYALKHED